MFTSGKYPCCISLKKALIRGTEGFFFSDMILEDYGIRNRLSKYYGGNGFTHVAVFMMSELLKALYDSSVPILGRLKVACYLWGQCDILPRGKNAFLLKWVCQELCLVYSKKKKAPPSPHTACKLWQFLSFVLNAVLEGRDDEETSVLNIHLFQVSSVC